MKSVSYDARRLVNYKRQGQETVAAVRLITMSSWYNLFRQSAAATDLPSTTTMMSLNYEKLQAILQSFSLLDIIQSNIIKSLSWIIFEVFVVLSIVCLAVHPILRGVTK